MAKRNIPAGLLSAGFQKITTNSTAVGLNTTTILGNTFWISVETQNARITFDGSTPAASTGVLLLTTNSPYFIEGVKGSQIKIARATSGTIVQVQAFKHTGE